MSESRNRSSRVQVDTTETENTPLNNINSVNQQEIMDADTKRVVLKIVIDIVLLGCGMFCNDKKK